MFGNLIKIIEKQPCGNILEMDEVFMLQVFAMLRECLEILV